MRLRSLALLQAAVTALKATSRTPRTRMSAFDGLARPDVCVLGGGFGGLYTALRLSNLEWRTGEKPHVTLIDRSERFAFLPMMYELTVGTASCWEVAPKFQELLSGSGVEFVCGDVQGLDTDGQMVKVDAAGQQRQLPYDQCVLALGSEASFGGVEGAEEHALPYYTLDDALQLREKLLEVQRNERTTPLRLVVVGGSYVGVELAANLRSWLGDKVDLTLVHRADALLATSAEFNRLVGTQRLVESGVKVHVDSSVQRVEPDGVTITSTMSRSGDSPRKLEADLVVWTAGSRPNSLASTLGIPVNEAGRIITDATLRVQGSDNVHALGDVSTLLDGRGTRPPATAQAAMQQADYAAWNVRAALQGDRPLQFRYAGLGEMLSLGEAEGSLSALGLVNLKGPLASASRRAIYAARMPTSSQATKVGLSWAADAVATIAKRAAEAASSRRRS